jgi:phage gpG-like protein
MLAPSLELRVGAQLHSTIAAMRPENMKPALRPAVERETIALQAHVVENKLSGQVLHVRTGTLRRSITYAIREESDAIIGIVGTNLVYAAIHEYGGELHLPEIRPRRAKALHFYVGGAEVFAMRARAHSVRIPERSFLRSALADRREAFLAAIREAIRQLFGGSA